MSAHRKPKRHIHRRPADAEMGLTPRYCFKRPERSRRPIKNDWGSRGWRIMASCVEGEREFSLHATKGYRSARV